MPRRSRRSARRRSSSARRCRPGPTWSASERRRICRSSRTIFRPRLSPRSRRRSKPRSARRSSSLFASFDPKPVGAASIAQVHRAVTTEGREVAVKVLRPGIEEEFARAIETYEWAAAHVEAMRRRVRSGCGRGWSSRISGNGPRASSTCSARPRRLPSFARIWSPSPAITCPRSTGGAPRAGC